MNKKIFLICTASILLCSILACMTTVEPFVTYPADTPTSDGKAALTPVPAGFLSQEPESGAVYQLTTENHQPKCATVTAAESLHLRKAPSERAEVVEYLHHGQIVSVINSAGHWWKIETPTARGWSNADFLAESECE